MIKPSDYASVYYSIGLLTVYISLDLIHSYLDGEEQRQVHILQLREA